MAVLLSVVLVVGMLASDLPQTEAYAAGDTIASGTDWTLDADGTLTITSNAGMADWVNKKQDNITKVKKVVIESGVTSIGQRAFYNCGGLTEVTIPDSVTSIGERAFQYCSNLTEVTIPDSVTSINGYAFQGCSSLTEVIIPDSVTRIGDYAFSRCYSLTEVIIPDSVMSIGKNPFSDCDISIVVEKGNMVYDSRENCNAIIETDSNELIAGCDKTVIPSSVTSIGHGALAYCSSLTKVTIPDNITKIDDYAFAVCENLTEVTISDSVVSIGKEAFQYCSSLTEVTISDSVTSIGSGAFYGCSSLTKVTMLDSTPPTCDDYAFYDCKFVVEKRKGIYVPEGKVEDYKAAWTKWADYITEQPHSLTRHPAVAATCTAAGTGEYWSCGGCNKLFSDADAENEINAVPILDKLMHSYGDWITDREATENEAGTKHRDCSMCGYRDTQTIPATEHTHSLTHHPVVAATCMAAGTGEYWSCGGCNKLFSDADAENEINAVPILDKLMHSYGDWITDREATENEAGTKHRDCSMCGYRDTQTIPATEHTHSLTHHPVVAATCMAAGTGEYWSCGGCNKLFSDADAENEINAVPILDRLMHNYGAWISNGDGTHMRRCQNADCSQSETENCSGGTATYTEKAVCEKCGGRYGELLADSVAPKGEISIATNRWTSFLHTITFNKFFKETEKVTITAKDQESGVAVVGYYISAKGLEEEEVREIHDWTPGNTNKTTFQISPDERCVIYTKITDCQGNMTYISSDGLEFDGTGPVISGIRDGESYCSPQVITVTDNGGLDTVKVNRETVTLQDGKFTLRASAGMQSVIALDKAGNSTIVTVTVNDGHSFGDWITDQEATENEAGTRHRACSVCGYKDMQTIPVTGSGNRPVDNAGESITDAEKGDVKGNKPKTGDDTQLELYATLAMISGLSYLLLYFADRRRGMTEETKKELVSRLARWAKQGGKVRKLLALAAIVVLLAYYHSIGKKTVVEWKDVYGE